MRGRRGKGDGSSEARLDAVEYNLDQLQAEFDAFRQQVQREAGDLKMAIEAEQRARAAATGQLADRIRKQAIGATDLQLVGPLWFVFGSIYSTVPDIVVSALHLVSSCAS